MTTTVKAVFEPAHTVAGEGLVTRLTGALMVIAMGELGMPLATILASAAPGGEIAYLQGD